MSPAARSSRRGFTLIELMLTLGLLGFVLVSAELLFTRVSDTRTVIERDAARADSNYNGERLARALVRSAESSPDSSARFVGNEFSAEFSSWCPAAGGWLERCRVLLLLDHRPTETVVIAQLSSRGAVELLHVPGSAGLRYLDRSASDTSWFDSWGTNILTPDAVAIVSATDTLILIAGGRGG